MKVVKKEMTEKTVEAVEYEPGFPAWRYHKNKEPKLCRSSEELKKLGDGWEDTPAKFEEKTVMPVGVPNESPKSKPSGKKTAKEVEASA